MKTKNKLVVFPLAVLLGFMALLASNADGDALLAGLAVVAGVLLAVAIILYASFIQ